MASQQSNRSYAAPLAGLAMVIVFGLIIAMAIGLFRSSFTKTVAVTVLSPRAGLVMNPDAKVKMHGVAALPNQVGRVALLLHSDHG